MAGIGGENYRYGAKERLREAFILLRQECFAGSIYLAGRAVEGMLRGLIWKSDPQYAFGRKRLETGHNLRDMLVLVGNLGLQSIRSSIGTDVQRIAKLWSNDMRFWPTAKVNQVWYDLHEIGGRRTLKQAAQAYYDSCSAVMKRCEAIWLSSPKTGSRRS